VDRAGHFFRSAAFSARLRTRRNRSTHTSARGFSGGGARTRRLARERQERRGEWVRSRWEEKAGAGGPVAVADRWNGTPAAPRVVRPARSAGERGAFGQISARSASAESHEDLDVADFADLLGVGSTELPA